jgi:ATP-dependent helicase/nuclease subunit B
MARDGGDGVEGEAYKREMSFRESLPGPVAEALARGATVVTANQRAAHTLRVGFERESRAKGLVSWQPASVMAWDVWTAGLWARMLREGKADKLLLSGVQELQVWRAVIEEDAGEHGSLESVDALAEMAADAWGLLCGFRCRDRVRDAGASEDMRAFRRWEARFRRRCGVEGYLTAAELEEVLIEAAADGALQVRGEILLVGFDKMTPAQEGLAEALGEMGVEVGTYEAAVTAELCLHAAEDKTAELRAAAGWLRRWIQDHPEVEHGARVAVIVPSVDSERSAIDRVFREVLAPELMPITAGMAGGPYEFSLGQPLDTLPMVVAAMDLLRWASGPKGTLPVETVSRLLRSPYFGGRAEVGARAEFDAFRLRRMKVLRPEISIGGLIGLVEGPAGSGASRWAGRLGGLLGQLRGLRRAAERVVEGETDGGPQRAYADWSEAIRELLHAAGWTDGLGDSYSYQMRQRWEGALDQLATLDFAGGRRSFGEALEALETVLQGTVFAPESRDAAIQVMGPLEAAGQEFDVVWFLRAGDMSWPVRSVVNPLLGWPLQREMGMPGANLDEDRRHALRVTRRIAASAGTVVFSYAERDAAMPEAVQRASSMLEGLELGELEFVEETAEREVVALEAVADDEWIPLANPVVRGGAAVLAAQAACGFRAFAEVRLGSTGIERLEPGMDAGQRGELVHGALENFWEAVRTQERLRAMSAEERADVLGAAIDGAIGRAVRGGQMATTAWDVAFLETQRERLMRVLQPWLEQELERTLPFSVRQREAEQRDVAIGPLRLRVRLDRVDETEAGDVLIDYKTGAARAVDWAGERPDAPQLPLYAVLSERPLAGVAFARVQPGKPMGMDGFAAAPGILKRPAEHAFGTLGEQVEAWREVLTRLAEEFYAGDARVRPKSYPQTCAYCEQRLLCRLNPELLVAEEKEEGGEENDG